MPLIKCTNAGNVPMTPEEETALAELRAQAVKQYEPQDSLEKRRADALAKAVISGDKADLIEVQALIDEAKGV